jgi:hypothetical protein
MKKAVFCVCLLAGLGFFAASGQCLAGEPFAAFSRVENPTRLMVEQLSSFILNPSDTNNLLWRGKIPTGRDYLHQECLVFVKDGYRFSLYYQWDVRLLFFLDRQEYLSIYVRPEGTTDPESLVYFKDFYLNGSWDEYGSAGIALSWEYFEGSDFDERRQRQFCSLVSETLEYLR